MLPLAALQRSPFGRRLARWWRRWAGKQELDKELQCCGLTEADREARETGMSVGVLAGKWPSAAELLLQRLDQLNLDAAEITRVEPQVMRDLQRACSRCLSKSECEPDLAAAPSELAMERILPKREDP